MTHNSPSSTLPKAEHPRPQLVRNNWLNLNGTWQFEIDSGDSGLERKMLERDLDGEILVPYPPESELSGIANTDFMEAVWYRRTISIPAEWEGLTPLLHFGAVDHDATVWVNGTEVARHRGGFTPFTANLDGVAAAGEQATVIVRARDTRHGIQARGKQATSYANSGCNYTRTTGIWQTVWLEAVPDYYVKRLKMTPDLGNSLLSITASLAESVSGASSNRPGHTVRARVTGDGFASEASVSAAADLSPTVYIEFPGDQLHTWSPEDPFLYDVQVELLDGDGEVVDQVESYTAMRSVTLDGKAVRLNGKAVFQRLVLDQGYWPESLMTSPSDEALIRDIELSQAAGFNGARLHQKVFEERFLFHADQRGYLVWGEFGDWGCSGAGLDGNNQQPTSSYVAQWLEALERDYNHPSIIGWCPLNETHQKLHDRITVLDDVTSAMFTATKLADQTRPVLDASGYSHRIPATDIYDCHSYEQDPQAFRREQSGLADNDPYLNGGDERPMSYRYRGQPYFVSEFGGIWWNPEAAAWADAADLGSNDSVSWGYGQRVRNEEELYSRFEGLCAVLLDDPNMFGYCYTQLTDVFQEENGIYRFDRGSKMDIERIRAAQTRMAAIESA